MKLLKKSLTLCVALMLFFCTCVPAMADTTTPSASDTSTITVEGVETGATVTAYKIVKPVYNNGLKGYEAVSGVTIADVYHPTFAEISAIAKNTSGLEKVNVPASGDKYQATVGAGTYLIVVSNCDNVYNPMIASVYYNVDGNTNTITPGTVSAGSSWTVEGSTAVAKKTNTTLDKKIVGSTGVTTGGVTSENGDDVAIGDEVQFQITAKIPAYSSAYDQPGKQVIFKLTDTLSQGLVFADAPRLKVTVDGTEIQDTAADFKTAPSIAAGGTSLTLDFASDYILANAGKDVVVTYYAKLTNAAATGFDPNTNKVVLNYSNNPDNLSDVETKEDKTYHYTFNIDANLSGKTVTGNKTTHELIKTDENGDKLLEKSEEYFQGDTIETALKGAIFELKNTKTGKVYTATSDDKGYLSFKGLDAGDYILKETTAPSGYSKVDNEIPVKITAKYNEDGTLNSYSITVNNQNTSTYSATYNSDKEVTNITSDIKTTIIKNTTLKGLPSTGGAGTYLFTIVGVAIMAIAAGIFFVRRRKTTA